MVADERTARAKEEAMRVLGDCLLASEGDAEGAHSRADNALCELLIALGYKDVVLAWRKVEKWYA